MSTETNRLSELAKEDPKRQFFSIAHLITPEKMYAAFLSLRKDASAGVDGVTYKEYEKDAARNIRELHQRLKDGKYRAQPRGRVYIPQENGKQRPILCKRDGRNTECHLRAGFSRMYPRVLTRAGGTPGMGASSGGTASCS